MFKLLTNIFIKDKDNTSSPAVRSAYGKLCSIYGIFLNILLFAGKYFAGVISGSVAITADAFNNLSDAGSSIITLLGFQLASKKPDADHPFGHGRYEYLAGLILSALILLMGIELGKTSIDKIIHPVAIEPGILSAAILVASILVKFYMSTYNKRVGKLISSPAMAATAADSLSDTISTAVVLVAMLISAVFGINIDGFAGLAVSIFIIIAGIGALKDTISPLLGQAPEKEFVEDIEKTVLAHSEVSGIHDLIVNDYGPGRRIISLHAEVDGYGDFFDIHDVIDNIESELKDKFGCSVTIHLDPVDTKNERLSILRQEVSDEVKELLGSDVTIHDFRMVPGDSHTNLIFDAVLPAEYKMSDEEAAKEIRKLVSEKHEKCFAVVNIDRAFV